MSEKKTVKGSEALLMSLLNEGVDTIFGYPGGQIIPTFDALYDFQDSLKHILVRHEQGAIHAAQGYARVTGKVGVCMVTSGPGATNLLTGIADAMIDSTPVICITGQVATHLLGSDAFQETDVVGISMPVTKWNIQITRPEDVPEAVAKAFYIARSGRPGPVLIDIARNAQVGTLEYSYEKCNYIRSYIPRPEVDMGKIADAAQIINNAQKPYILVGQGVLLGEAESEFKAFVEKSGIPFAWTVLGACAAPIDHPLNMGMLGMHGHYGPNIKSNECDVMIAIGMRFDDRVTGDLKRYATNAKIIHLEIDPAEIDKNVKSTVAILGNVKDSLPMLTSLVQKKEHKAWIQEFKDCFKIEKEKVIEKSFHPTTPGISMGEVIDKINQQTKGDCISVTDVGQHQMFAARYALHKTMRSFVTSGGLGTMGFGIPAALGAKIGAPDKQVILYVGDGGIQMTMQEMMTMIQSKAAVKIVLLNNNFLGMVRQWQELFWEKRYSNTLLENPDFQLLAKAFGLGCEKVSDRANLDGAIAEMLKSDKAYLLEVVIEKEENVFPMVPAGASVSDVILEKKS
jgi:acetolactate synthase-1/2/3 large subunit